MSWGEEEFKTIELGGERLNRRAVLLAERLAQKPSASIPGACESWAETAAAYRFLRNKEVSRDKVVTAHWQASQTRMAQHEFVLCIQDTTELDYNGQQIRKRLKWQAGRGHASLVSTPPQPCAKRLLMACRCSLKGESFATEREANIAALKARDSVVCGG